MFLTCGEISLSQQGPIISLPPVRPKHTLLGIGSSVFSDILHEVRGRRQADISILIENALFRL